MSYRNWGNCSNINTSNNSNFNKIVQLCNIRRAQDASYAEWIDAGKAWWFFVNLCNGNPINSTNLSLRGNCVSSETNSWENDSLNFPLPEWWWKYPEIPAPSIEWLSKCIPFSANSNTCLTEQSAAIQNGQCVIQNGVNRQRRDVFLPPRGYTGKIPKRINLYDINSWILVTGITTSNIQKVTNDTIQPQDVIVATNITETFDNIQRVRENFVIDMNYQNQSWLICSIIVIVILIIVFFFWGKRNMAF